MNNAENERVIATLACLGIAGMVLPGLSTKIAAKISLWCLAHNVLVPAHEALLAIPGLHAGFDMRRLAILTLLSIALISASRMRTPKQRPAGVTRAPQ